MKSRSELIQLALWVLPLAFLGIFFFYPLASILLYSFNRGASAPVSPFIQTFTSPYTWRVLGFTFWQALLSTLLTLLIGLPGAYLVGRYQFRGKSLLMALTAIPFVMPTLVVAAALNALIGQRGWLNLGFTRLFGLESSPLVLEGTLSAILLAHVFYNTTIVLRTVGDFWSHLDPRLQQAARVLGANGIKTLWTVSLPLLAPAISAAALLVFIFDFTSFGVILVLGGPRFATLEVEIFYQTTALFNLPQAAVLSLLQLACTLVLTTLYSRLSRKLSQPLSLRPVTYTQRKLLGWRRRIFAGVMISLLLALLIAPLAALAARSFTRLEGERGQRSAVQYGLTFDYYKELATNQRGSQFYAPPGKAIGISLSYAMATVILALVLGLPAAWALSQGNFSFTNRLLDSLLMLPLGTSAVTLGLGFILALDQPPLDLRASPLLVPLAHTLVALPFVVRSLVPALRSIKPRLRQAASVLGASPWQVARTIDLPLTGRAILVAAAFAFTISLGEFGATALIARPEYPTVPVMIYRFLSQPGGLNYGQAMALSTMLMIVCAAGMLAIERLRIADVGEF